MFFFFVEMGSSRFSLLQCGRVISTKIECGGLSVFSVETLLRLRGFRRLRPREGKNRDEKTPALKNADGMK
jgi:hypothetical protein